MNFYANTSLTRSKPLVHYSAEMRQFYQHGPEIMRGHRFRFSPGNSLYQSAAPAVVLVRGLVLGGRRSSEPSSLRPGRLQTINRSTPSQMRAPLNYYSFYFFTPGVVMVIRFNEIKENELFVDEEQTWRSRAFLLIRTVQVSVGPQPPSAQRSERRHPVWSGSVEEDLKFPLKQQIGWTWFGSFLKSKRLYETVWFETL